MFRFNAFRSALTSGSLLLALCAAPLANAEEVIPGPDWEDDYDPIASADAVVGGKVRVYSSQYPNSYNYYLNTRADIAAMFSMMYDTLLTNNPLTLEFQPHLAEKCVVSDDKLTFTFHMDPRAKWSDGKPITAHDVAFTYETVMKPENLTGPHKVGLEKFNPPEVIDELTIRFKAKEVHWRNLLTLGFFEILPKHVMEGRDFNKINFDFPVVSGRYRLGELKEGVYARMERRSDWWLDDAKRFQGTGNFQTIEFRYFAERDAAYDAFMNGDFDLYAVYTAHVWVNQTDGEAFDKNWIVKQAIYNYNPTSWQGFAMNQRREPFNDPKVRLALAHLVDRRRMNSELMFKQYQLHTSYVEDLYDQEHENPNEFIEFNKEKARQLLNEAGWTVNPQTGKLEKDGKPFVIRFLTRETSFDKFLVIYKEALADLGIEFQIVRKDWPAWSKDMDEFNFDMTTASWSGTLWKDPEFAWYSKEADRPAGGNITGFKDPRVDELIEKQRGLLDVQDRNAIMREIDQIVYGDTPYVLLWFIEYTRLLYWNKFGTPWTVLSKYGDEQSALMYWWIDPDAEANLEEAMKDGEMMAPRPYEVRFDDEFDG